MADDPQKPPPQPTTPALPPPPPPPPSPPLPPPPPPPLPLRLCIDGNRSNENESVIGGEASKEAIPTNIDSLPEDILSHIFMVLPADYLWNVVRFVCQWWCHIIESYAFIIAHFDHSSYGLLLVPHGCGHPVYLTMTDDNVGTSEFGYKSEDQIVSSCNGLVLELDNHCDLSMRLRNLATSYPFHIPPHSRKRVCVCRFLAAIGYTFDSMEYKVILPCIDLHTGHRCLDILTLGIDECWRSLEINHISEHVGLLFYEPPLITEGFMHWGGTMNHNLTLNLEYEIFTTSKVPLPESYQNLALNYYYLSTGRYLSLLVGWGHFSWEIWEMNPRTGEWRKLAHKIELEAQLQRLQQSDEVLEPIGWVQYPEVLAYSFAGRDNCILYNLDTHEISTVNVPDCRGITHRNTLARLDSIREADVKLRILASAEKIRSWMSSDISDSSQLKTLKLPDSLTPSKVMRLLYTNSGAAVLALASNALHKLWKWQRNEQNPSGKSSASSVPQLWQPNNGALMSNDVTDGKAAEDSVACIALSENDSYVMSASGGKVSLFNMITFKVMKTFMPPPPAATYLAFHPQDNNIIAIGMEDSTVLIYNVRVGGVKAKLKGHKKRISGLAFSQSLNVLVSSGADAQLFTWSIDDWEKKTSCAILAPPSHLTPLVGETRVQFHNNQSDLLVVHETQIAIYDAQLDCLRSWYPYPRDSVSSPISSATYSCDGLLIFTGFCDGVVGIFDYESLNLRCRIAPSAYISSSVSSTPFPVVIAAHPKYPDQFALGMSDGAVRVIEPSDAEMKWGGGSTSQENGALPSVISSSALNSQPSETPSSLGD